MEGMDDSIMSVFSKSHTHKRVRKIENTSIKELSDMESLSSYLSTF